MLYRVYLPPDVHEKIARERPNSFHYIFHYVGRWKTMGAFRIIRVP